MARTLCQFLDLICADGLYRDAGYSAGQFPDPHEGFDNLDFWTKDKHRSYRDPRRGNRGDATDLFDGFTYTRLDPATNPSTHVGALPSAAYRGVAIARIERRDEAVEVDIRMPSWAGTIREEVHWAGQIRVDADITVAPEGRQSRRLRPARRRPLLG